MTNTINFLNFLLTNKDLIMLILAIIITIASVLNKLIPNEINKYISNEKVNGFINFNLKLLDILSLSNISRNQVNKYEKTIQELENFIKNLDKNK